MEVSFDIAVILYLFNKSIHTEFTIERKAYSVYLIVLVTRLITTKKLTNEFAVDFVVSVEIALTILEESDLNEIYLPLNSEVLIDGTLAFKL